VEELTHLFRDVGQEVSRDVFRFAFGFDPEEVVH
jgi:hypothetical protein